MGQYIAAIVLGVIGAAAFGASTWLFIVTARFYSSSQYAPHSGAMPSYHAGWVEADGSGVFVPAILLLLVAVFFLKFAWNLWRQP